jgi:hypothetical protein
VHGKQENRERQSTADGREYLGGRARVKARRRFVDEQHVRLGDEGTGDVEASLLTAGEGASVDADPRVGVESAAVEQHAGEQVGDGVSVVAGSASRMLVPTVPVNR